MVHTAWRKALDREEWREVVNRLRSLEFANDNDDDDDDDESVTRYPPVLRTE